MRMLVFCLLSSSVLFAAGDEELVPNTKPRDIKGWGEFVDPAVYSKVVVDKENTLVMTAPEMYVDNDKKTKAPRVMQKVSGDFAVEVTVVHVEPAKPNTVLEELGNFPIAYHSATLLVRHDNTNFIRFENVSRCTTGDADTRCDLHLVKEGGRVAIEQFPVKAKPTRLKLERNGKSLLASYSQDDGKTWQKIAEQDIAFLPDELTVGVSMTSNTKPGCTVKFRDLKVTPAAKK